MTEITNEVLPPQSPKTEVSDFEAKFRRVQDKKPKKFEIAAEAAERQVEIALFFEKSTGLEEAQDSFEKALKMLSEASQNKKISGESRKYLKTLETCVQQHLGIIIETKTKKSRGKKLLRKESTLGEKNTWKEKKARKGLRAIDLFSGFSKKNKDNNNTTQTQASSPSGTPSKKKKDDSKKKKRNASPSKNNNNNNNTNLTVDDSSSEEDEEYKEASTFFEEWQKQAKSFLAPQSGGETLRGKVAQHFGEYVDPLASLSTIRNSNPSPSPSARKLKSVPSSFNFWYNEKLLGNEVTPEENEKIFALTLRCVTSPTFKPSAPNNNIIGVLQAAFRLKASELERAQKSVFNAEISPENYLIQLLEVRLQNLDRHPFFPTMIFTTREDFQKWKQEETRQIQKLSKILFKVVTKSKKSDPLTAPRIFTKTVPETLTINLHKYYLHLMARLVIFNCNTVDHSVRQYKEMPKDLWDVLHHFGELFGIRPLYQNLGIAEILAQSFDPTPVHLQSMLLYLRQVTQYLISGTPLSQREKQMFDDCSRIIFAQVENFVVNYRDYFRKAERSDRISDLLSLLREVVLMNCIVANREEKVDVELTQRLAHAIGKSATIRYQHIILQCDKALNSEITDGIDDSTLFLLSTRLLDDINSIPRTEIKLFKPYFKLDELIMVRYYAHFKDDLHRFTTKQNKGNMVQLSKSFFALIAKSQQLNLQYSRITKRPDVINSSTIFQPLVLRWINDISTKLLLWTDEVCKQTNFEAAPDLGESILPYSASLVDVFCIIQPPLQILQSLRFMEQSYVYLDVYAKIVAQIFTKFLKASISFLVLFLSSDLMNEFELFYLTLEQALQDSPPATPLKNFFEASLSKLKNMFSRNQRLEIIPPPKELITITRQICTLANNTEEASSRLVDLVESLEDEAADDHFDDVFQNLRQASRKIVGVITFMVIKGVRYHFELIINWSLNNPSKTSPEELDESPEVGFLIEFLDNTLLVLGDNLYPTVFARILRTLWIHIINEMVRLMFPVKGTKFVINQAQAQVLSSLTLILSEFFHAEGAGPSLTFLSRYSAFIPSVAALHKIPTQDLIHLYNAFLRQTHLVSGSQTAHLGYQERHILSLLCQREDPVARKFAAAEIERIEKTPLEKGKQVNLF